MANTAPPKLFGLDPAKPGQDPGNLDPATTTVVTSTGANDAFKIVATGANGLIDPASIDGTSFGKPDIEIGVADAAITAPAFVNTYNNNGVNAVRLANSTAYGTKSRGLVMDTVAAGATVKVYRSGLITGFTGLTIGQQYLSVTPGQPTAIAPGTGTQSSAAVTQKIGNASSATTLHLQIEPAYGL